MSDTILEVKDLKKYFKTKSGTLHAVDGLNFKIERGRTLACRRVRMRKIHLRP